MHSQEVIDAIPNYNGHAKVQKITNLPKDKMLKKLPFNTSLNQ
jgi:hypothetical protein